MAPTTPITASSEKERGNEAFQAKNFSEAIKCYSRGLDLNPDKATSSVLYSNRSAAHLKLYDDDKNFKMEQRKQHLKDAIDDARKAIQQDPSQHKPRNRLLLALARQLDCNVGLSSFEGFEKQYDDAYKEFLDWVKTTSTLADAQARDDMRAQIEQQLRQQKRQISVKHYNTPGIGYSRNQCAFCGKAKGIEISKMYRCSVCKGPRYCCKEPCQQQHWDQKHADECDNLKAQKG